MRRLMCLVLAFGFGCDDGGGGDTDDALVSPPSNSADTGGGGEGGAGGQGAAGGGQGGEGGEGGWAPADCIPDRDGWDDKISGHIDTYCSDCHSETPQFGATLTLLDYDKLLVGPEGSRPVDRMAFRLGNNTMPPRTRPQPMPTEEAQILAWATCDDEPITPRPPNPGGFDVSADPLTAPEDPPADAEFFDFVADEWAVPNSDDHYECFNYQAPTDSERFIRRIDAIIDDSRVVHHLVLMRGSTGPVGSSGSCFVLDNEIYAWAPGMGALQFPEGGLRMAPGERFFIQVHYNNRANHDSADSSGVRIYHSPAEGPEVGMVTLGPTQINIPANGRGTAEGHCVVPEATTIIGTWPHMHELGYGFESYVVKQDGSIIDLVTLSGWDFETQFVYDTPVQLDAGDRIVTKCEWRNTTSRRVGFGPNTDDEMCFNFTYHSPPLSVQACNQPPPVDAGTAYEGGACLEGAREGVPVFRGTLIEGAPPELAGGLVADGTYSIRSAEVFLPVFESPLGTLDGEASFAQGRGVVILEGDNLTVDFKADVNATLEDGRSFNLPVNRSFAGPFEASGNTVNVASDCGDATELKYQTGFPGPILSFQQNLGGFITLTVVIQLEPLD